MEWAKVLLVDHDQGGYETLRQGLAKHGYEMHTTAKIARAMALVGAHRYQAALVALPLALDTDLLPKLHAEHPALPLIIILSPHDVDVLSAPVIDAATHIIGKPLLLESVRLLLDRTLELVALRTQVRQHRQAWCDMLASQTLPQGRDGSDSGPVVSLDAMLTSKLRHIVPNLQVLGRGALYRAVLSHVERLLLTIVLHEFRGNQVRAAEVLGINRNTLRKKIRDFDIAVPRGGA